MRASMVAIWAVAALAAVAFVYLFRVRQLTRREVQLSRLVDERTAELRERTAQLEVANAALEELATVDSMTGLANRRRFDVFIQQEWQRAERSRLPLSLLLVDIDHFKMFNDRYGHPAGDECIRQVASVLRAAVNRVSDLGCRYGGEEFALLLPNTAIGQAAVLAERLRATVASRPLSYRGLPVEITCSFGVAHLRGPVPPTLIELADEALYQAKRLGRNRVEASADL
jgi:diguanylate cyclase (GGDEF)-like protein